MAVHNQTYQKVVQIISTYQNTNTLTNDLSSNPMKSHAIQVTVMMVLTNLPLNGLLHEKSTNNMPCMYNRMLCVPIYTQLMFTND